VSVFKTNNEMLERILQIMNIRPAENFQVSKAQNPIKFFGLKGGYMPNFGPFGSHLGVPPGDGKVRIFKLKI